MPKTLLFRCPQGRAVVSAPRRAARTAWPAAWGALLLAACVHSAPAAVHDMAEGLPRSVQPASACGETTQTRQALAGIARELKDQGLAFTATCSRAAEGAGPAAWVVQVRVVDGMKAIKLVRGPLADGHEVDMGTPAGVDLAGAPPGSPGFSPDVQHNRAWLRALMARHQFDNLPNAWWHFAQRGGAPAKAPDSDLAAR